MTTFEWTANAADANPTERLDRWTRVLCVLFFCSGFPALTLGLLAIVVAVMFPNYAGWTVLALVIACLVFATLALRRVTFISMRSW